MLPGTDKEESLTPVPVLAVVSARAPPNLGMRQTPRGEGRHQQMTRIAWLLPPWLCHSELEARYTGTLGTIMEAAGPGAPATPVHMMKSVVARSRCHQ